MKRDTNPRRGSFGVRALAALGFATLVVIAAGCSDDEGPTGIDDQVASVEFTSGPQEVEIGSTTQLVFEIRDEAGALIDPDDVTVDFSSSSTAVATVSGTGVVTPVAPGTATITIEVGSFTDTVTITIVPEISAINVVDAELDLLTDETLGFDITVLDAEGDPVVDPVLTFTSSAPGIVSVDDEGNLTGVSPGTATVTVAGGGESDSIAVTVFAAASGGLTLGGNSFTVQGGDALDINELAIVRDAGGTIIPDAARVFVSTDAAVATVDATGTLTALAPGTALITVTSPDAPAGSEATFRLDVLPAGSVDLFGVAPATGTVAVGNTLDLGLNVVADGTTFTNFLGIFSSSDEAVATVNPFTGLVTGISAGVSTITVTNGALTSEAVITVQ